MILSTKRDHPFLENQVDADLQLTQAEWELFQDITDATYRPRTIAEFNAMCDLAGARYAADYREAEKKGDQKTCSVAMIRVINASAARFGADGECHFSIPGKEDGGSSAPPKTGRPKLSIVGGSN